MTAPAPRDRDGAAPSGRGRREPGRRAPQAPAGSPPPAAPALLLRLQSAAGNAAVADLVSAGDRRVQRLAGVAAPPAPVVPRSPAADPAFRSVTSKVAAVKKAASKHPPAKAEAAAAAAAAKAPPEDKQAQAEAAQAGEMAAARPGGFDKAAFIAAVNEAVAKQAPQNLDEADKFATSGKADAVKAEVAGTVTKGKEQSAKPLADSTAKAPDPGRAVDKPVTPLPEKAAAPPPAVDTAAAAPGPAPAQQTELRGGKTETDAAMASAGVSEQTLAASNEPQFTGALDAKRQGEQHAATAPAAVRQVEQQTLSAARNDAGGAGRESLAAMHALRGRSGQQVAGQQTAAQARDERRRAEVTTHIRGIFEATKTDVNAVLTGLDGMVAAKFDEGERTAKAAFTADHQARMKKYKDERYDGVSGALRWTADLFTGLPAEGRQLFQESKKVYVAQMQRVISDIADLVGRELGRAKDRVAAGRAEIAKYVASQPKDLQKVANDAAKEIGGQFEQLESSIDEKSSALVDDLAAKYVAATKAVDDEITKMQEESKGLWDRAKEAVGGAIETILQLKSMLMGVLARAAGAVEKIIKDPIGFLGNLVNAVKSGVMAFGANIVTHLKEGLKGWLFGNLAAAGIEIPDKLDVKGILKMVLSLLGLTWANVRQRILRFIPEPVLKVLEGTVAVVGILVNEGLPGLWKWVLEKLGDLKEMVLGQIKEFVVEKIVKAGIVWIVSLLNPAAAFIKACKAIYDVVMFFVEKASQIKEFVDSVLDSIESIASGGAGAVAGLIERTLAKALPMVLGFLASLLGLGGISEKIKGVLEKVTAPVNKVIDSVVGTIVKAGKKLLGKLGGKKSGAAGPESALPPVIKAPFRAAGKDHSVVLAKGKDGQFDVTINSTPTSPTRAAALTRAAGREALVDVNEVSSATAAILDRSRRLREMARTAQGKSGVKGPVAAVLSDLGSVIAACWDKIGFDGEHVDRVRRKKGQSGQVGDVGRHQGGQGVREDSDPTKSALVKRLSKLESEHVVPWSWIDAMFSKMFRAGSLPSQKNSRVYPKMTTVMTYKGAAAGKTWQAKQNTDMEVLRFLRSIDPRIARTTLRDNLPALIKSRMDIIRTQTKVYIAKVAREHNVTLDDKPDEATVRKAASAQLAEIFSAAREL